MKQLHFRAVWLFFIGYLTVLLFLLVIFGPIIYLSGIRKIEFLASFFSGILTSVVFWIFVIFFIAFLYTWSRLSYHYYRYELTDRAFRKEYGVIWKKYVSIPYGRIQNIDISRGIWARILGLSTLQIHTAGVGGVPLGEGILPGLNREDAEKLREELMRRVEQQRGNQGL